MKKQHIPRSVVAINTRLHSEKMGVLFQQEVMRKSSAMYPSWRDIIEVSAGEYYTLGLREDGSVIATGKNEFGQCNISDWRDIIAISAGTRHSVGLRADGTVVAVGENKDGQCNVSGWRDIVAVEHCFVLVHIIQVGIFFQKYSQS